MADTDSRFSLICRAEGTLCALPLAQIVEIMRPLPIEPLDGAPDAVAGIAIVRGEPLPIVAMSQHPGRFVIVRAGPRRVGLAVDQVIGVRALPAEALAGLPPLIAHGSRRLADIGVLDGDLLLVLDAARIVPDETFAALTARAEAS